jgi:hypothetical protein
MSFAPPTPTGPAGPHRPGAPRSTPIPGFESPLPGNAGAAPPPRPTEFVNATPTSPMGFGLPADAPPPVSGSSGRSWGAIALVVILFAGPILGLGVGVWAFLRSRETADQADQAIDDAQQTVDSVLQQVQEEIDAISVPATVAPAPAPAALALFADGGAPALIAAFDAAISGEPSRFMQVLIYPDYAFVSAQDAGIPDHVDEYPWRDGVVGASSPVTLVGTGDLEATLWSANEVDWTFLARAVTEAPGLTTVEEGVVSHIIVDRSVFTPDFAITVKVYVSGPRGGGYVEYTPAGQLIQVVQ